MNIFRLLLPTPKGNYLVDTVHHGYAIEKLRIHPIENETVGEELPLDVFDPIELLLLIVKLHQLLLDVPQDAPES